MRTKLYLSCALFTFGGKAEYIEVRNIRAAITPAAAGGVRYMRREQYCRLAAVAGAFGLGALLVMASAYRLALIIAAGLLIILCRQLTKW